jgi:N-acetylglutamate synthase-like GNAT family acetyltransferase
MPVPRVLPPNCLLRPACSTDKAFIRRLLNDFKQEVLPPRSPTDLFMQWVVWSVVATGTLGLTITVGPGTLLNLLAGPAIVLASGILIALVFTWNEDWEDFWVIEYNQAIIACAKLRCHSRYSVLHDVYVIPKWRSQGLGSYLVKHLGERANRPLYLTCMPNLVAFYRRLGFTPVCSKKLPPLLQYDLGIPGRFEVVPLKLS